MNQEKYQAKVEAFWKEARKLGYRKIKAKEGQENFAARRRVNENLFFVISLYNNNALLDDFSLNLENKGRWRILGVTLESFNIEKAEHNLTELARNRGVLSE